MAAPPRVILLGGAPCSGKGTVARALATLLDHDMVSTDDLGAAARAMTSAEQRPDLHPMAGIDYRDYYLARSGDELWQDALRAHRALWPAIESVVTARSSWGTPAIVEGWAILPELVPADTFARWLLVEPAVLADRLRHGSSFTRGASDPERLVAAFTERSRRYNDHVETHAAARVLRIGAETPAEIAARIAESW